MKLKIPRVSPFQFSILAMAYVLKYAAKGYKKVAEDSAKTSDHSDDVKLVLEYLEAVNTLKHTTDAQLAANLIQQYKLVQEHVPTWLQKSKEASLGFNHS